MVVPFLDPAKTSLYIYIYIYIYIYDVLLMFEKMLKNVLKKNKNNNDWVFWLHHCTLPLALLINKKAVVMIVTVRITNLAIPNKRCLIFFNNCVLRLGLHLLAVFLHHPCHLVWISHSWEESSPSVTQTIYQRALWVNRTLCLHQIRRACLLGSWILVFLLSPSFVSRCTVEIDSGVMEVFPLCCGDKSNSSPECI